MHSNEDVDAGGRQEAGVGVVARPLVEAVAVVAVDEVGVEIAADGVSVEGVAVDQIVQRAGDQGRRQRKPNDDSDSITYLEISN